MLNYRLAQGNTEEFSQIQNISEGLEHRMISARGKETFDELISTIKCKRYPHTRIRRALYSILLDLKKTEELPCYTRVLAFTEQGQKLLRIIRKNSPLKVYSRITKADVAENSQLQKELFFKEIFNLAEQMSKRGSI